MHPEFELFEHMFKQEVYDRAKYIDSAGEQDWFSLTLGWAIGKGLSPEIAHSFALHIRYNTELG